VVKAGPKMYVLHKFVDKVISKFDGNLETTEEKLTDNLGLLQNVTESASSDK
jgi:hypothetical protein